MTEQKENPCTHCQHLEACQAEAKQAQTTLEKLREVFCRKHVEEKEDK